MIMKSLAYFFFSFMNKRQNNCHLVIFPSNYIHQLTRRFVYIRRPLYPRVTVIGTGACDNVEETDQLLSDSIALGKCLIHGHNFYNYFIILTKFGTYKSSLIVYRQPSPVSSFFLRGTCGSSFRGTH